MNELISAEELLRTKIEREILAEIVAQYQRRIADLDSVLSPPIIQCPTTSDLQRLGEGLDWKTNSRGEWTFVRTIEGEERKELSGLLEAISRAQGSLTLGRYVYSVSSDRKFLNRRNA